MATLGCCDHCTAEPVPQVEIAICGFHEELDEQSEIIPSPPPELLGNLAGPWHLDIAPTGHPMGGLPYDLFGGGNGAVTSFSGFSGGNFGGGMFGGGGGGLGGRRGGLPLLPDGGGEIPPGDQIAHLPEPSSLIVMLAGTSGMAMIGAWRRRRAVAQS